MAAWAPKRYHRAPSAPNAPRRSASSSATGERDEGTGGALDETLEAEVVREVAAAFLVRGPIGTEQPHVLPQGVRGVERSAGPALGKLPRPVLPLPALRGRPASIDIRLRVLRVHAAMIVAEGLRQQHAGSAQPGHLRLREAAGGAGRRLAGGGER